MLLFSSNLRREEVALIGSYFFFGGKRKIQSRDRKIRKELEEMEQKTAGGKAKKRRAKQATDIKTVKAALN